MGTSGVFVTATATRFFILLSTPFSILHHRSPSLLRLSCPRHNLHHPPSLSYLSSNFHTLPFNSPSPLKPSTCLRNLHLPAASSFTTDHSGDPSASTLSFPSKVQHPFPEWSRFLDNLSAAGYFDDQSIGKHGIVIGNEFVEVEGLSPEFSHEANAFLVFARDRPKLLRLLSRKDVEVVVINSSPFLFKNADDSVRRMKSFLESGETPVLDTDRAQTIDLMKFMISCASTLSSCTERGNIQNRELVIASVQKLLGELAKLSYVPESNISGLVESQSPARFQQSTRPARQNIEMKVGDWICPRCSFMNFARNGKCLECQEARPKRQLTGGEWDCPQCDFFNYGRNQSCLRCDCKRPGERSFGTSNTTTPGLEYGTARTNNLDVNSRLAANEEKARRFSSKISQQDSNVDINSAIADEDFPEIMPLRKGVNRFVVSSRKTPLERRLSNSQYRENLGDGMTKSSETSIHRSIDEILGRPSHASSNGDKNITSGNVSTEESSISMTPPSSSRYDQSRRSDSNFVPLDSEKLMASPENKGYTESGDGLHLPGSDKRENEEAEKSDMWFKRVAELHNVSDSSNSVSDGDFPEIMPLRKGENRFVVGKKKDRSLTSPAYKRRLAMEQASSNNYVPFVPFPPGYFAKKDNEEPNRSDSSEKNDNEATSVYDVPDMISKDSSDARLQLQNRDHSQEIRNQQTRSRILNTSREGITDNAATQHNISSWSKNEEHSGKLDNLGMESSYDVPNVTNSSLHSSEIQNIRESWTGKSLEGSAVKELDPMDMSEEAKAERWFRRVAQIKDISELSQIPDEDFPSIMPMRKGVNRFVVSKRKTPLERRLTSQQYRKNLPVVNTDPLKRKNEGS